MSVCPAAWAVPGQGSNLALILPAWGPQAAPIPSWAAVALALVKGEACTPLVTALVGTLQLLESSGVSPSPPRVQAGAGMDWGLLARPGLPPPSVPGAARRATGLIHQHTTYGAGVLQTHSWGWGRRRNPGDQRAGWGAAVSRRQQSRQKTSLSSPGS